MTRVRVDLNISLDGYATTVDQTPDDPFGADWLKITAAYAATRTFRARVLHDASGKGSTGVDEKYARRYFENIGAEIMGAGMFGLHERGGEPDWRGWWGDEPPFRVPVYVLTHETRPSLSFANGTEFHFVHEAPDEVLALARAAAKSKDVRIGGGAQTVRTFLAHDLVDDLHVGITPVILGQGTRLWADLRRFECGRTVTSEIAESGTIHVTFKRESP